MNSPSPLLIGFDGTSLNKKLQQHLLKINPAGVVLFKRNIRSVRQIRMLILELRDLLGNIIVAVDHEGGVVNRLPDDCPVPPSPRALWKTGSKEIIRSACRIQAEVLAELGFSLNFAPVVDLDLDPENQVIGSRSHSNNPLAMARYVEILVAAHDACNIGTTVKHFPSHGRTTADSHFESGVVNVEAETLWNTDFLPYRKAFEINTPCVMTAHLTYPCYDPDLPATLSYRTITEILREKLKFSGLIISDCVEMSAIHNRFQPKDIVGLGMKAGLDLIISSHSLLKSDAFQLRLKEAYDQLVLEGDVHVNRPDYLDRLTVFNSRYRPDGSKQPQDLPESVIDLHRKSLSKRRMAKIPKNRRQFYLVELSNRHKLGVNLDEAWNPISKYLQENFPGIAECRILSSSNKNLLVTCVREANRQKMALILLTANGYRQPDYDIVPAALKLADFSVHIALLNDGDITGEADIEWVSWGYNVWTAKAIVAELNEFST